MADENSSQNNKNDISNICINIKKHIKTGRHRTKNMFHEDSVDEIDPNVQMYNGIDYIKALNVFLEENNLGEVEFNVFNCKTKSKLCAYYANITLENVSVASSFPEKYSLPEVAKQVAARKALVLLKNTYSRRNIPVTQDFTIITERLEQELQKNYAGLFCDKIENIYKEVYNESLPLDWLSCLSKLKSNIMIENLPKLNKSILYYKKQPPVLLDTSPVKMATTDVETETNLIPLMKFLNKTERTVKVITVDSNHTFWILFVQDSINDEYGTLLNWINMPEESSHFNKMFSVEEYDVYAVKVNDEWYRFQATRIEENLVTGIFIDLGIEWCVNISNVMFLPPKFLKVPSQAVKCALTSLFYAPYFEVAKDLFHQMLFNKEFTVVPDNIDCDVQLVTLYNGKCNMNNLILEAFKEKTSFNKITTKYEKCHLSYIGEGYTYLHPANDTLLIMENILNIINSTRPFNSEYSTKSISPHKLYLVKCTELDNMWSRAVIEEYILAEQKFKVYFVDYGNYGLIDQDKFVDLESIDPLLAAISYQALKVVVNLFPPGQLTESLNKALYEMLNDKPLDIEVVSTNKDGIQEVEIYDGDDPSVNRISFNAQLYQSV